MKDKINFSNLDIPYVGLRFNFLKKEEANSKEIGLASFFIRI